MKTLIQSVNLMRTDLNPRNQRKTESIPKGFSSVGGGVVLLLQGEKTKPSKTEKTEKGETVRVNWFCKYSKIANCTPCLIVITKEIQY